MREEILYFSLLYIIYYLCLSSDLQFSSRKYHKKSNDCEKKKGLK